MVLETMGELSTTGYPLLLPSEDSTVLLNRVAMFILMTELEVRPSLLPPAQCVCLLLYPTALPNVSLLEYDVLQQKQTLGAGSFIWIPVKGTY